MRRLLKQNPAERMTPLEALNLYANLQRALVLQEIEQDLVPCVNYSEFNR